MLLKTPKFWFKQTSFITTLLEPFSLLYAWISKMERCRHKTQTLPKKVICVGNLTLGGSGKTPTVMALSHILKDQFFKTPHILSRGYGSQVRGIHKVNLGDHPTYVGDEPLLLAKHAPTWVGRDRYTSGSMAIQAGADILLMDDGLQNPSIHKDLKILVVDSDQGFGNGHIFPAGPLRISLEKGMKDVDAIVLIHETKELRALLEPFHKPIFSGFFESSLSLPPQPVIAFAGIGYPEKFKSYLIQKGFDVRAFISFPDHYAYTQKDMNVLYAKQRALGLPLITTEKDCIKLPTTVAKNIHVIAITLTIKNNENFYHFLEEHLDLQGL
ncbi:MAG: tetraacyldisaccharide 4'-kinase [Alphaproteobacteria bacterium]|nr:tetraacyldisaccharide 4'-kinase [Alphaproteobacteria bacterium]